MKFRYFLASLACLLWLASCDKNSVSKIPHIKLVNLYPLDSMRVNVDTPYIEFQFTDGDADIATDPASAVYLKDSRYPDTGFRKFPFPVIDQSILDPKKGISGTCYVIPLPIPTPRTDPNHLKNGDTLTYELYMTDNAGNESNHEVTHPLILR
ncbi:MAG: hypothetical protein EBZ77_14045 [Chitinophagia bacterium]|nr:hypothetical protein [Chitinophagia bacterium]